MSRVNPLNEIYGVQPRIPLPGLYPCLTWQMNVTVHRSTGLCKFVSVLREPTDHVEISRRFGDLEPWDRVHLVARDASVEALGDMGLLMGFPTRLYT